MRYATTVKRLGKAIFYHNRAQRTRYAEPLGPLRLYLIIERALCCCQKLDAWA